MMKPGDQVTYRDEMSGNVRTVTVSSVTAEGKFRFLQRRELAAGGYGEEREVQPLCYKVLGIVAA